MGKYYSLATSLAGILGIWVSSNTYELLIASAIAFIGVTLLEMSINKESNK